MSDNMDVYDSSTGAHLPIRTVDISGVQYPVYISALADGTLIDSSNPLQIQNNLTPYQQTAWTVPKVAEDFSLFHGVWTYIVPNRVWEESSITAGTYAVLDSTGTLATSAGHLLEVASGTTANNGGYLRSKRNPRYQPNRGHHYSTAVIMPNATGDGIRKFGLFTAGTSYDSGVYFELEGDGADWALYAVRKSNGTVKKRQDITSLMPSGFDPEKGHVYDIKYHWRGVGNYYFFCDLELVYTDSILGTLTELSMAMPAVPVSFESVTHTTTELKLQIGCVDVTSEGGREEGRELLTINTGTIATNFHADSTPTAMLAIKNPRTVSYGGNTVPNTRDVILSKVSAWVRDEASVYLYTARDNVATAIDANSWTAVSDSALLTQSGGDTSGLQTDFVTDDENMDLRVVESDDLEMKNVIDLSNDDAPFYLTPGDILVVAVEALANDKDVTITVYMKEEL